MKRFWEEVGLAIVLGMIVPGIILRLAVWSEPERRVEPMATEVTTGTETNSMEISVLMEDGTVSRMELDDYLTGVVLAEMPASFEKEALKAQAVVARTYTLRANGGKSKHEAAAVCTDSACCQAYRSPDDYLQAGGSAENLEKVSSAVEETENLVLLYDGELIEATYFSCSGGSTEDAVAVWGTDVPYLKATSSPGEEGAAHYTDWARFTQEELETALEMELDGAASSWIGTVTYTAGGGVDSIEIGGTAFAGTELRKRLGLRSTAFTVETGENDITFHTRGYGHRVGMSQYGADAMAASGSTFDEILAHYYRGTVLERMAD